MKNVVFVCNRRVNFPHLRRAFEYACIPMAEKSTLEDYMQQIAWMSKEEKDTLEIALNETK